MSDKYLLTGNEAIGEAAIRAGCDAYFGYPITPQNELTAYMAANMPKNGRVFVQAEAEIAAINMVFGASAAGKRVMTSSSSPGISLKQEGISYIAGARLPAVIVNVQRGGPGLGSIGPAQSDYFQATKGGGHGDYRLIVYAPSSVNEAAMLVYKAFDMADLYRMPVMILADGILGQMMEPVSFPDNYTPIKVDKTTWALSGAKGRSKHIVKSLYLNVYELNEHNKKLQNIYKQIQQEHVMVEIYNAHQNPDLVIVSYGTVARVCKEAIVSLKDKFNITLIRPITLWPFPYDVIKKYAKMCSNFLVCEMNAGQMLEDVKLAMFGLNEVVKVDFFGEMGGVFITPSLVCDRILKILK